MTLADELKVEVASIILDVNTEITRLMGVINRLETLGNRTFALKSHNMDVAKAGGILSNVGPEQLRQTVSQLQLTRISLEDYLKSP